MSKRMLFMLAAFALVAAGIYSRSLSEKEAKNLVNTVQSADVAGANSTTAISDLQSYVKSHVGASVTYTLTGSYNRAVTQANAAASAQNSNGQIYAAAQAACSGKTDSITQAKCNQAYLQSHLANLPPQTTVLQPKLSDYQFSLRSPSWTPDLTGSLFLGALAAFILGLASKSGRRH